MITKLDEYYGLDEPLCFIIRCERPD